MTPIAAYYVMVVSDHDRTQRRTRYDSIAPKASVVSRIMSALEYLVSLGRPTNAQAV